LLRDAFQPFVAQFSGMLILNVCSHRKQSFRRPIRNVGEGREAATSGHNNDVSIGVRRSNLLGGSLIWGPNDDVISEPVERTLIPQDKRPEHESTTPVEGAVEPQRKREENKHIGSRLSD
jgi:hypothetical protein